MAIKYLLLRQFRNYLEEKIEWHPDLNIICGANAQGKSNLVEALCYISCGSSYREAKDQEMLGFGQDFFYLEGLVEKGSLKRTLSVGFGADKKKLWRLDGQPQKKLSQILGVWHTVLFSPEDLQLVKSGPANRRRFLNREMLQLYPEYYLSLNQYQQALSQRNELLRQSRNFGIDKELLRAWDDNLTTLAADIFKKRQKVIARLSPLADQLHRQITQSEETLNLGYESFLPEEKIAAMSQAEIKAAMLAELETKRREEMARGLTLVGPHRDDLLININGFAARQFGSQGQQRTAALALKLAEVELVFEETGFWPGLLLDDVMSELDTKRQKQVLELMVGKVQTFITHTNPEIKLVCGRKFLVESGKVRPLKGA